ncbi:MAG: MATE family efflux transporter [Sulfolobales archaeon]
MVSNSAAIIDGYRDEVVRGPVVRTLLKLGFPLMIVQLVQISYNIADAFWLSKYSDVAMAVPRQVWPLLMFFNALLMALSTANMALLSQYVGARKYDEASGVASRFLTVATVISLTSGITYFLIRYYIFRYIVIPPQEIFEDVMDYSAIITFDLMLFGLAITYSTILQSVGDTKTPAVVGGVSAITNIVLDPLLILGIPPFPRMGVSGAAIATVFSRFVGVIVLGQLIRRKFPDLRVTLTKDVSGEWVIKNLTIGGPFFVFHASNSLAFMFQNGLVNSFGVVVAAAFAIGFIVMEIADAVIWGLTMPTAIMVGQNLGAGNLSRCRSIALKSSLSIGALTAVGAAIVYLFRTSLITIFTSDPSIINEATSFLETFIFTIPFFALFFVGMSVGRGSGHTLVPTVLGIIRLWVIRVGIGYVLAYQLGLNSYGVWVAMALSNVVSGTVILAWVKYGNWVKPVIK